MIWFFLVILLAGGAAAFAVRKKKKDEPVPPVVVPKSKLYRVKQVDKDGKSDYSIIINVVR